MDLPQPLVSEIVARALSEDVGHGDLTARTLVEAGEQATAHIVAKAAGIICGLAVAREVFRQVDASVAFSPQVNDGDAVTPGQVVAQVAGPAAGILTAERTALNFLQHLSGVATATRAAVEACRGTRARILDTRKTLPGLRALQKYAVRVGGGANHRFGLYDAILIKENHIKAAGGVSRALQKAAAAGHMVQVEVEVETLEQLQEALAAGATRILLDNMDPETMRRAVQAASGRARLEASGGLTLERLRDVAATGVDYISVGALTHSARALDLSLRLL